MAWIYLLFAGLLETAWAASLKSVSERFEWQAAAFTAVAMIGSLVLLALAMARLPLGVAYPIWTGIGAVGAVVASVAIYDQSVSFQTTAGVVLLLVGMTLIGSEGH